jgi:FkbM family methyltransferase
MRPDGRTIRRLKKLRWSLHRPSWTTCHGVRLPVKHPLISAHIAREIFLGDYEREEIAIISEHLHPQDVVLEVGTGLGFLSAYCARRTKSERVFTFEANPSLVPLIEETYRRNDIRPQLVNAVLAEGTGSREFFVDSDFWASSSLVARGSSIQVPQLDLNSEIRRIRPTFLIVDIEGGESEFFATADLTGVRKICVETHPHILGDAALSEMLGRLVGSGFVIDMDSVKNGVFFLYRPILSV